MSELPTNPVRPLPPLRIHHLVAWTALTGVMLAIGQQSRPSQNLPADVPTWWHHALLVQSAVGALMSAAAVTVVLCGMYGRRRAAALAAPRAQKSCCGTDSG